jgi:iron(III) transport system ATP-binding protein
LDEPLSNLDAKLRHEMRSEIRRVCKEFQLTTIYVTHDQKEALSIADRMAVMDQGNVLQVGSPLEVYKRPRNRFVANFIGDSNFLEGKVLESNGESALVETPVGRLRGFFTNTEEPVPQGGGVTVSLRPESIRLVEEPPAENRMEGSIGSSVYYGEVAHYTLEAGDTILQVSELNPRHLGERAQGKLYASAEPEDVVFLNG